MRRLKLFRLYSNRNSECKTPAETCRGFNKIGQKMGKIINFNEIKKKKDKEYDEYITERILLKAKRSKGEITLMEYAKAVEALDSDPRGKR